MNCNKMKINKLRIAYCRDWMISSSKTQRKINKIKNKKNKKNNKMSKKQQIWKIINKYE